MTSMTVGQARARDSHATKSLVFAATWSPIWKDRTLLPPCGKSEPSRLPMQPQRIQPNARKESVLQGNQSVTRGGIPLFYKSQHCHGTYVFLSKGPRPAQFHWLSTRLHRLIERRSPTASFGDVGRDGAVASNQYALIMSASSCLPSPMAVEDASYIPACRSPIAEGIANG